MSVNNRVLMGISPVARPSFASYSYDVTDSFTTELVRIPSINQQYAESGGVPIYFSEADAVRGYFSCTLYDIEGNPWIYESAETGNGLYRIHLTSYGVTRVSQNDASLSPLPFGFITGRAVYNADIDAFTCMAGVRSNVPIDDLPYPTCRVDDKLIAAAVHRRYEVSESRG